MRRMTSLVCTSGTVMDSQYTYTATFISSKNKQNFECPRSYEVVTVYATKKTAKLLDKASKEDLTEKEFKQLKQLSK